MHFVLQSNHALLEEIKEINRGLIDTVVSISEEDVDLAAASVVSEGGGGTVITCSFTAVALGPNQKLQYVSAQMVCKCIIHSLFMFHTEFLYVHVLNYCAVTYPTIKIACSCKLSKLFPSSLGYVPG